MSLIKTFYSPVNPEVHRNVARIAIHLERNPEWTVSGLFRSELFDWPSHFYSFQPTENDTARTRPMATEKKDDKEVAAAPQQQQQQSMAAK